ncbi:protein kinase [Trypanosoma grayi]|uniref:protein kinase n=1 Tax=Trypanosoma grayi TaxID=71804 RepID=UPI0004F47DE8|nr:protein kinase [Trypanosoma grayi]KEG10360.1 protein kinase [Trypanosoma grayi]
MKVNGTICRHPLASKRFLMVFRDERGEEMPEMFELLTRYEAVAPIARGTYGFVCAARDNELVEEFQLNPPAEYSDENLTKEERAEMYEVNTTVAVKKLRQLFERNQPRMWLCATREIQLMMAFNHENVMSATDFFIPLGECETMTYESVEHLRLNFDSVYVVMKKMDYTLREVLESSSYTPPEEDKPGMGEEAAAVAEDGEEGKMPPGATASPAETGLGERAKARILTCPITHVPLHPLQRDYRMYILYQLLRGVGYLHLCPVIHRDIKPENIMLDRNYSTRVCDFGQGRDAAVLGMNDVLQTYLDNCTQWYAAPETLTLNNVPSSTGFVDQKSFHGADVWSIGCIAAEMLMGRPLFYSKHFGGTGQLHAIMGVLGSPTDEEVENILQHRDVDTRKVFQEMLKQEMQQYAHKKSQLRQLLTSPYNDVDEEEVKLIENFLRYGPCRRMTIQEALQSPFFINEGYDPVIDPDDTATHVRAVQADDIVEAVKGREFLWSLFLQRHPEVQELVGMLERRKSCTLINGDARGLCVAR